MSKFSLCLHLNDEKVNYRQYCISNIEITKFVPMASQKNISEDDYFNNQKKINLYCFQFGCCLYLGFRLRTTKSTSGPILALKIFTEHEK
jgi:hypothetical protein